MSRFSLVGDFYQSISSVIDAETALNLYPEVVERQGGRSAMAMLGIDGLSFYAGLPAGAVQVGGLFTFLGRTFTTGRFGNGHIHLYEITGPNVVVDRGDCGAPVTSAPAIFAANPTQLAFTVGGMANLFAYPLNNSGLQSIALSAGTPISVAYLDGFGVALIANSNTFMVSNTEDFTTWQAINTGTISEFPDQAVSMVVNSRRLWFLGQKQSVPYFNSGALFPFIPVPDTLIEEGSIATFGVAKLDNTILWIGGNVDQGVAVAYRMTGTTPTRISNHAIETIWQSYPTVADAITYAYQSRGHKFWHIYFPTANASWRYDISTQMWHQVGSLNQATGQIIAHRSQCHTFNFGVHLVGDPTSGSIYAMSPTNLTEAGRPIPRIRRAPAIAVEHQWVFHHQVEVLCEVGMPSNIQAPSDYAPFLNLVDANGALWTVTINDAGAISIAAAAAGQVASGIVILADNVNQTTFWQIGVSVGGGALTATQVPIGNPRVANFYLASKPIAPNLTPLDTGLQVNQVGVVSAILPQARLRAPQLLLRWSDDNGKSWSNYYGKSLGLTGESLQRVVWRRLGKSRNRIYEISCSDPIALRIADAFLDADPEFKPTKRLTQKLAEAA